MIKNVTHILRLKKLVCRWKEAAFEQNAMVLSKAMPTLEKIDPCGHDGQQTALGFGLCSVSLGTTGRFLLNFTKAIEIMKV